MKNKINLAIFFGGQSVEHEVSILSARSALEVLNPKKYNPHLIWIDKKGGWHLLSREEFDQLAQNPNSFSSEKGLCGILPGGESTGVINFETKETYPIDVAFPILHGLQGEDGTIQGLFELMNIPYVGAGVVGSAVGMDKDVAKRLLRDRGIKTTEFLVIHAHERHRWTFETILKQFPPPFFIKPANSGSSVGIRKVVAPSQLAETFDFAFSFDQKIIVERAVHAREIECGVIGNEHPTVSLPCEIAPRGEFHSYESKYLDLDGADCYIPASLTNEELTVVQQTALKAYQILCCTGMARVDLFLTSKGEILVNEINTIPGLTPMSPFPKMWEATGLPYSSLLDRLIQLALDRAAKKKMLIRDFSQLSVKVCV